MVCLIFFSLNNNEIGKTTRRLFRLIVIFLIVFYSIIDLT